jgi:enterochelin esterase-like enzyme
LSMSGGFSFRPTPATEFEWATHQLAATERRPVRYYLTAGTLETVVSRRNYGHYLLATNRHLRDVLRAAGYDVTYREFSSVHSELNWQDHLYDGLVHLLPAASRPR